MKTRHLPFTRLFAAGLMSAALAVPAAAAGFVRPVIKDVLGRPLPVGEIVHVRVTSPKQLLLTLYDETFHGRVIVPANAQWDLSGYSNIPLSSGVQLIGERGDLGSRPRLYTNAPSLDGQNYSFFKVMGNDVRVEGIHFEGPANTKDNRSSSQPRVAAIKVIQNLSFGVVIADCEFNEWTKAAVQVECNNNGSVPREHAERMRVERNYIHHNATDNDGYGVGVGFGSYVTIEGNVFDFNRHAVGAECYCGGYISRYNYVLQGGFKQGDYYNQHFDAHGQYGGYGGRAGQYFEIAFNTIRGEQSYYVTQTRPALMLRGRPEIALHFSGNVLVHDDQSDAVSFKGVPGGLAGVAGKYYSSGNQYDTDPSRELASGDFDGDGRTDAFVATGTAWFFSRGGQRPWEFLQASRFRTGGLGFADIDNDRVTDVLWQLGDGAIEYSKSGTGYPARLTSRQVPMKELRFGDFDGDGKTDIFYTQGGQWYVWYGRTRLWTSAQSSSLPISELLFGEFDDARGTDVVGVTSGVWAYSSAGTAQWAKLNDKLVGSFAGAVAADFDGSGKSDIAFSDGQNWHYSRDGRSPLAVLRDTKGLYPSLRGLLIGPFDGGTRAKVVHFDLKGVSGAGERLVIWRGLGSGSAFSLLSQQNMR